MRALWDDWSRTCPEKFSPEDQEKTWSSFGRDYDGPRITVGTIYHLAARPTVHNSRFNVDCSRQLRADIVEKVGKLSR